MNIVTHRVEYLAARNCIVLCPLFHYTYMCWHWLYAPAHEPVLPTIPKKISNNISPNKNKGKRRGFMRRFRGLVQGGTTYKVYLGLSPINDR